MRLTLIRFAYADFGTFGKMVLPDGSTIYSVECPWLDNRPNVSCIPEGVYKCRPRRYFRGGYDAVEICDVPGRSHCLLHRANAPSQLRGCIAPVSDLGCFREAWGGLASGNALTHLMELVGGGEWELEITHLDGPGVLPSESDEQRSVSSQ